MSRYLYSAVRGFLPPVPTSVSMMPITLFHTCSVLERARQSTRIRKRKYYMEMKKKKEERLRKNPPGIPYKVQLMLRAKGLGGKPRPWRQLDERPFPTDEVWGEMWHTWNRINIGEALDFLREDYHPSMLNKPDGIVWAKLEFNMSTGKVDRYIEGFSKMVPLYNPFERGVAEKSIMVFAKDPDIQKLAIKAGANQAGGMEMIDEIAKGRLDVSDFDYFLAHSDIQVDLKPLVGILRDKFPKKIEGTVGDEMEKLVKTFQNGLLVTVKKPKKTLGYEDDPSYGFCESQVGRLSMDNKLVEENIDTLLETMMEKKLAKMKNFISRCQLYVEGGPVSVGGGYKKYSIVHNLVEDPKFKEHAKQKAKLQAG